MTDDDGELQKLWADPDGKLGTLASHMDSYVRWGHKQNGGKGLELLGMHIKTVKKSEFDMYVAMCPDVPVRRV